MLRPKKTRTEWLWLLFFFLTAGCELTVDNLDFESHMTDDLVNVPRTSPKAARLGGRHWAAPYISDVREAQFRPERVCRYWHAAQAAWRMQCDPFLHEMPPGQPGLPQHEDDNWALYLDAVALECSPDWLDLPWREVEGIAVCAELIIDSPCEYKGDWLRSCLDGQLPLSTGPIRPI